LLKLGGLPSGNLSKAESLEQLTWLEQGYPIKMIATDNLHLGVDTHEDLKRIEAYIKKEGIRLGEARR
jgi:3-deoxy-manno-octulosonate cytidylyltransferase (CMP-KDO synthetase)